MPFKSEKQRKWMHTNDPEMAKKWEKKEKKMKREQRVKELIRKMVREIMNEDFAGAYPKSMRKKFDGKRRKQSEVLGYKLTGKDDVKTEIDDATIKEGKLTELQKKHKDFFLMSMHKDIVSLKGQIAYAKDKVNYKGTPDWEKKEFKAVLKDLLKDLKDMIARQKRVKKWEVDEGKLSEGFKKIALKNVKYKDKEGGTYTWEIKSGIDTDVMGGNTPKIILHYTHEDEEGYPMSGGNTFWLKHKNGKPYTPQEAKKLVNKISNKKIMDFHRKSTNPSGSGQNIYYVDGKFLREGKLTEDFKNNEWEVYVADENRKEKIVKVAKSKRAAVILYNKLIKTDKYHEVGMRVIKEGKINERMDKRKAATILKQIGGNKFIAMTGAKGFAFSDKYMSFKIGRNSKGINFVRIGHNAKDLYDMEFGFVSVKGIKVKKKVKDVYADMLGQIFKKHTGMNVRL